MRIGELAEKTGLPIQTIRFYEREKILRKPQRTSSGYRAYASEDLHQVEFIKVCQGLGFTLNEIRTLSTLHSTIAVAPENGPDPMEEICRMAMERLRIIDAKIETLQEMRRSLLCMLSKPNECPSPHPPCK